jgi:hypothetical protein
MSPQTFGEIMATSDIDEAIVESIRQELRRRTGKQVERVDGAHGRVLGRGAIFELSSVGDTRIFVVFRPALCREGSPASAFVREVAGRLEYLPVTEPFVIQVDEKGVHDARPVRSYAAVTT